MKRLSPGSGSATGATVLAEHAADGVVPQLAVGAQQRALGLGEAGRIGQPLAGQIGEGGGRLGDLGGGRVGAHLGVVALDELGEDVAPLLEQAQQVAGKLLRIHRLERRQVGLRLGIGLLHWTLNGFPARWPAALSMRMPRFCDIARLVSLGRVDNPRRVTLCWQRPNRVNPRLRAARETVCKLCSRGKPAATGAPSRWR